MKAIMCLRTLCCTGIATAILTTTAFSQAVAPANEPEPAPPKPIPVEEDIVELSPFVVSAEKESGYMAKETLAGMRLKTDLKDVGAAIDVLTDQFLNDMGAIDISDGLKYVANMQYADLPDGDQDANNLAQWSSFSYHSRGIPGNTVLIDFFSTGMVPIDRYSTQSMTFMRGANSILFGIGSPSGIIGSSSKRAYMTSNPRSVSFMIDEYGSARTELDVNQVLLRDRLAVRIAGVMSDKHTFWTPSLNRRNAIYGTLTYKPNRNMSITVLAEHGVYERLFEMNNLVADAYTPWENAGRPMINFMTGEGMNTSWNAANNDRSSSSYYTNRNAYNKPVLGGIEALSGATVPYLVYIEGSSIPVMDWRAMPRGARHYLDVGAAAGMVGVDRDKLTNTPFTRDNTIIDQYANIWGGLNTIDLTYDRQAVIFEQRVTRDFSVEVAANHFLQENYHNRFGVTGGSNIIWVDASEVLPDGTRNPYAGMPYIETNSNHSPNKMHLRSEMTDFRVTLSYELNLDRHKIFRNLGFGNYRFGGLFQDNRVSNQSEAFSNVNITPLPGTDTSLRSTSNVQHIRRRYYLRPGENIYRHDGNMNFHQASVPGTSLAQNGPITTEYRNVSKTGTPTNFSRHTSSLVLAVQGAWWFTDAGWPRLTGLYGVRQDHQTDRSQVFARDRVTEEFLHPYDDFNNIANYGTWGPEEAATVNTKSWNLSFRPISMFRFFYNYSDIRLPSSGADDYDIFGQPIRAALGETKDYGVKFEVMGDRLFLSLTKFQTDITDAKEPNINTVRTPINHIYASVQELDHLEILAPKSYRDQTSTGYELSLDATPIKGWNIRIVAGAQKSKLLDVYTDVVRYYEIYRPVWDIYKDRPITSTTSYATVQDAVDRAEQALRDARARIGLNPLDQRRYNVSVNTGYTFQSGLLKGVRIGGGCRWVSENVIGWARDADGNFDPERRYRGDDVWTTSAFVSYTRRLFKNKLTWTIHLNLQNLLNNDEFVARNAVDDGTGNPIYTARYPVEPFRMQLTNTFKF